MNSQTVNSTPHLENSQPRLLMLTHRFPFPPNRGDRIRTYNILCELSKTFSITLGSLADEPVSELQLDHVNSLCKEVIVVATNRIARLFKSAGSLLQGTSVTESTFASSSLTEKIKQAHQTQPFDCVLVFCSSMFQHVNHPEFQHTPIVVDLIDVDSCKWEQMGQSTMFPKNLIFKREANKLRIVEQMIADTADSICLVSSEEANLFQKVVNAPSEKTFGVCNGVDTDFFQPPETLNNESGLFRLVFTGVMNYAPNVEGVDWFCRHVFPKLRESSEVDVQLDIVGRSPNSTVERLDRIEGVNVVGGVPDMRPFLSSADVAIAPLKLARGIQNKVLEAMAMQLPVVCTPQAAEGIDANGGEHLLISKSAQQWHDALISLANNRDLRTRLGRSARKLVVESYSWSARLAPLVGQLVSLCPSLNNPRTQIPSLPAPIGKTAWPASKQSALPAQ